ncbi:response regulator [Larkinella bovis]|uniref:Response regulator n=1 Tax=Larkinella bovis TaxID=683041 RepID=A0ABW0IGS7_9BACT
MMTKKQKILVVDDDPSYRQLITHQLTKAGYEVLIAKDGQEAISWLRNDQQRPNLIVLDLLMPRYSGIEVLESLRAFPFKLPVILVSGAEWPIARQGMALAAPDAYLTKPFKMQDLLEKIGDLLLPVSESDLT